MVRARTPIAVGLLVALVVAWFATRGGPPGPGPRMAELPAGPVEPARDDPASLTLEGAVPADRVPAEGELSPRDVVVIEGIVLRARRAGEADPVPLPGARLEVGPWSPPSVFHADDGGRFRFELARTSRRATSLLLSAGGGDSGFLSWSRRIDFPEDVDIVRDVRVLLVDPCPATGQVVDVAGAPVVGVALRVDGGPAVESDATGRFTLQGVSDDLLGRPEGLEESLEAERDGWEVLAVEVPGFDEEGRWGGIRVVMTGAGSLVVRAVGSDGVAVEGLEVSLGVARDERFGARPERVLGFKQRPGYGTTDDGGRVAFAGVPAGVHLVVETQGRRHTAVVEAGDGAARLVPAQASSGRPLCLVTGEEREVELALDRTLRLTGRVLEVDGSGSPEAELRLGLEGQPEGAAGSGLLPYVVRTDAEGRFDQRVQILGEARALTVHARSRVGERPSYSMFGGTVFADPLMAASARIDLATAGEGAELELRLAATEGISGTVVDAQGAPVFLARVRVLEGPRGPEAASALGYPLGISTREAGTFHFDKLLPGAYTVEATSSEHGIARVEGVRVGAAGLVLRFGEVPPVTVTLEVRSERPIATLSVARARLDCDVDLAERAPLVDGDMVFRDPVGFPASATQLVSGTTSFSEGGYRGTFLVNTWTDPEGQFTVAPGVHWFAARGTDEDQRALFPMGTGPLRLASGEHRITLHLVPAAALDVRVEGAEDGPPLLLQVRCASGELVRCGGPDGWPRTHFELAADGTLTLESVPAAPLQVEVGTWAELEAGAPRARAAVHPRGGVRAEVVL